jgi:hypothetical protein
MENVIATKAENAFDNEHLSNFNSAQQTSLCAPFISFTLVSHFANTLPV